MTSRERVLAALDHRETEIVPVDFSGHRSSGIAALAYPKLREYLGLEPKTIRVYDPVQQLAIVDEDVLDRFGVDTIELGRGLRSMIPGGWTGNCRTAHRARCRYGRSRSVTATTTAG